MEPLLLVFLALAIVGLFFVNSRGRKQQAKQNEFRDSLAPGQQVMTSSGQLGAIVAVDGDAITIETTPGVYTRWVKAAIQQVPPQFASVLPPEGDLVAEDADEIDVIELTVTERDDDAGDGRSA